MRCLPISRKRLDKSCEKCGRPVLPVGHKSLDKRCEKCGRLVPRHHEHAWPEINRANERKELLALADALLGDLFEAADEEILEELREAGHTPETLQQERQKNLEEAKKAATSLRYDEGEE